MKSTVIYMTSYSNSPHHSLLYGKSGSEGGNDAGHTVATLYLNYTTISTLEFLRSSWQGTPGGS